METSKNNLRIAILTSDERGIASPCLRSLSESPALDIAGVIVSKGVPASRYRHIRRRMLKVLNIGLPGAINGIRIRGWFKYEAKEDIRDICEELDIPCFHVESTNSAATRSILSSFHADLGLSLGNSYIAPSVFTIPQRGMINIHTELLPEYQGAQSVLWPIYHGRSRTGFSIHMIDRHIDTGNVLFRREYGIEYYPTLEETVRNNIMKIHMEIPQAFVYVCENFDDLSRNSVQQEKGRQYTTPTFREFMVMVKKNKEAFRRQGG